MKEIETIDSPKEKSMFIEIERTGTWRVVYNRITNVMYAVSNGCDNAGTFTLLVNADGTPMLYYKENHE